MTAEMAGYGLIIIIMTLFLAYGIGAIFASLSEKNAERKTKDRK